MSDFASLRRDFDRDGFVLARNLLDEEERQRIFAAVDRYIAEMVPTIVKEEKFYEDLSRPETLKQLHRMKTHDPFFDGLIEDGKFRRLAEALLDGPVDARECEWFNKPPGANTPTPPHQDGYYFKLEPNEALTMWIAIDPVDESNGCLRYVRGSHRRGMRPHASTGTLGFSQGIVDFGEEDRSAEAAVHLQPGDVAVHHSLTIHRAEANQSNRHRRSLGLVYYSCRAKHDAEASRQYVEQLNRSLAESGRI